MQLVSKRWAVVISVLALTVGALCLLLLDPLLANAPWWASGEDGLGVALLIPALPWVSCATLAISISLLVRRIGVVALASLASLGSLFIPAAAWTLLLDDVFPDSGTFEISMLLAIACSVAFVGYAIVLAIEMLVRGARRSRTITGLQ